MTSKFSTRNSKLNALADFLGIAKRAVVSFDIPALPFICIAAQECLAYCYAAFIEKMRKNVKDAHFFNYNNLVGKTTSEMVEFILSGLDVNRVKIVRIHSFGEYFHVNYFRAWVEIAKMNPHIIFFGYTKVINFALAQKPDNFILQYSYGGKMDKIRDDKYPTIPTCFVGIKGQWVNNGNGTATRASDNFTARIVCNGKNHEHEDYMSILNHETFVIMEH